jgi:hypothetical protein
MEYIQLSDTRVQITAQGLADFCKALEEKFAEGYQFNFEENDTYPHSFGTFYHVALDKPSKPTPPPTSETIQTRRAKLKE